VFFAGFEHTGIRLSSMITRIYFPFFRKPVGEVR
jgi:hypothetical protein